MTRKRNTRYYSQPVNCSGPRLQPVTEKLSTFYRAVLPLLPPYVSKQQSEIEKNELMICQTLLLKKRLCSSVASELLRLPKTTNPAAVGIWFMMEGQMRQKERLSFAFHMPFPSHNEPLTTCCPYGHFSITLLKMLLWCWHLAISQPQADKL